MESLEILHTHRRQVMRRLHAYLRCLGIQDDEVLGRLSDQIMTEPGFDSDSPQLEDRGLQKIFLARDIWFKALSGSPDSSQNDPLVGWRLRAILRRHPEALLCEPDVSSLNAENQARLVAVPRAHQANMPEQPLGSVPAPLRGSFWRGAADALKVAWHQLVHRLVRD